MQTQDHISPPSKARVVLFRALFVAALVILLQPLWRGLIPIGAGRSDTVAQAPPSQDDPLATMQIRFLIGIRTIIKKSAFDSPLIDRFIEAEATQGEEALTTIPAMQRRLILYEHMGLAESEDRMRARLVQALSDAPLQDQNTELVNKAIDDFYIHKQIGESGEYLPPTNTIHLLNRQLGFYGRLATLRIFRLGHHMEYIDLLRLVTRETEYFAMTMMKFMITGVLMLFVGTGLLILFTLNARRKKLRWRFAPGSIPAHLIAETFVRYLFLLAMQKVIFSLDIPLLQFAPMSLTLLSEALILFIACYPIIRKTDDEALMAAIGIGEGEGLKKEFLMGLAGYVTTLPLLGVGVLVVLLIVWMTGMDPMDSSHPIAPLIQGESTSVITKMLVVILAVAVAPIIEEVMFRGFYYNALRSRFGAPLSILLSAITFAAIHPQGALGVPMLTAVAVGLATLREWRGTLIASIVMHACVNGVSLMLLFKLA